MRRYRTLFAALYYWPAVALAQPQPDATYSCAPILKRDIKRSAFGEIFDRDTRIDWGKIEVSLKYVQFIPDEPTMRLYEVTIRDVENGKSFYCEGDITPRKLSMMTRYQAFCRAELTNFGFDFESLVYTASQFNMKPPYDAVIEFSILGRCTKVPE